MKRGATHLDWAISMGIFLVALISIFIYLRPLSQADYSGGDLVDIVKEKFSEDAYWVVKELPLFVEPGCVLGGEEFSVDLVFQNGWRDVENKGSITVREIADNYTYLHNLDSSQKFDVTLVVNPIHCEEKVSLGVVENTVGISDELLDILDNKKYSDLRTQWNFPPGRDFAIFVDDEEIIGGEPSQRANIFAEQSKEFIVSEDG